MGHLRCGRHRRHDLRMEEACHDRAADPGASRCGGASSDPAPLVGVGSRLTTTTDHNEARQRAITTALRKIDSQASDGNRRYGGTLQAGVPAVSANEPDNDLRADRALMLCLRASKSLSRNFAAELSRSWIKATALRAAAHASGVRPCRADPPRHAGRLRLDCRVA